jgi:hypothetical protein
VSSSTKGTNRCDCWEHPNKVSNMTAATIFTGTPQTFRAAERSHLQLTVRTPAREWHFGGGGGARKGALNAKETGAHIHRNIVNWHLYGSGPESCMAATLRHPVACFWSEGWAHGIDQYQHSHRV